MVAGFVLAAALVAAAGFGVYSFLSRSAPLPFQNFTITQITNTGKAELAAISPDGKYILNVQNDNGMQSLWLRNVPSGSNTQIIPPAAAVYDSLAFAPDGNYVYFRRESSIASFNLFRAPVLGGAPQLVVRDIDSNATFAPDGRRMAYVRANDPEVGKYRLLSADPDGSNETVLQIAATTENIPGFIPTHVAWSPDGSRIAYDIFGNGRTSSLQLFDVAAKQLRNVHTFHDKFIRELQWMPDGHSLLTIFSATGPGIFQSQVGVISYPGGKLSAVTRDTNSYATLTASADGKTLATVQRKTTSTIELTGTARPASLSGKQDLFVFDWLSNSDLVISDGRRLIHVAADGAENTLVSDPGAAIGQLAACGERYLVLRWMFHGESNGANLWRINRDGSGVSQLTSGRNDLDPACSPDGRWVYYFDHAGLERVSIDGGQPQAVPGSRVRNNIGSASNPVFSPDRKSLFFISLISDPNASTAVVRLAAVDLQHGQNSPPHLLDINAAVAQRTMMVPLRLTPDGRALAYPVTSKGVDNLWAQPLDGSPGRQITNYTSGQIADFRWSPDGKTLAVVHQHTTADVVLLRQGQE